MAHKKMTLEEVIDYIESDNTWDDFSFRGDDYIPARNFRKSSYHGDDEPEYQLHGVSAVNVAANHKEYIVKAICTARKYGENVFLLRGEAQNADEVNHDPDEVVMVSHKIVGIVDVEFVKSGFGWSINA